MKEEFGPYISGIVDAEQRGEIEYFSNGRLHDFSIKDVPREVASNESHPMRFLYKDSFSPLPPPYSRYGCLRPTNSRDLLGAANTVLAFLDRQGKSYKGLVIGPGVGRECYEMRFPPAYVASSGRAVYQRLLTEIDTISLAPFNPTLVISDQFSIIDGRIRALWSRGEVRKLMLGVCMQPEGVSLEVLSRINLAVPEMEFFKSFDLPIVNNQFIANMPDSSLDLEEAKYSFIYDRFGAINYADEGQIVAVLKQVLNALREDGVVVVSGFARFFHDITEMLSSIKKAFPGKEFAVSKTLNLSPQVLFITKKDHPVLKEFVVSSVS